jgi:hypothetical protein
MTERDSDALIDDAIDAFFALRRGGCPDTLARTIVDDFRQGSEDMSMLHGTYDGLSVIDEYACETFEERPADVYVSDVPQRKYDRF